MKYIAALLFSASVIFVWWCRNTNSKFWLKFLYNEEFSKKHKKIELKIALIIWGVLTISAFVYVHFFK